MQICVYTFSSDKGLMWSQEISLCHSSGGRRYAFVNLCPAFRQIEGGQGTFLVLASFQFPLAQNNPYGKLGFWGWAYSATLQD